MPHLTFPPDEPLHVLVPSRAVGTALEALSPRIRAHRINADEGPAVGEAAQAQVWVPRTSGAIVPDNGFLAALPNLRLVQLLSAGAEKFIGRLPEDVLLCNARGAHTPSTAEWSFTTHRSLVGARVLVIGAGDIGRAIGRMLAGFDVELTYVARTARDGVRSTDELRRLLPRADVVILVVPVTPETRGMVDAEFLAAMPDGALLVNAARGVVVDTDALLAELTAGRLRAALDVTDPEPLPEGHPLWSAPGLLLTPHVGGEVPRTGERAVATVVDQMRRILAGEPLVNVVAEY